MLVTQVTTRSYLYKKRNFGPPETFMVSMWLICRMEFEMPDLNGICYWQIHTGNVCKLNFVFQSTLMIYSKNNLRKLVLNIQIQISYEIHDFYLKHLQLTLLFKK
jgi:hypothetical protein